MLKRSKAISDLFQCAFSGLGDCRTACVEAIDSHIAATHGLQITFDDCLSCDFTAEEAFVSLDFYVETDFLFDLSAFVDDFLRLGHQPIPCSLISSVLDLLL